MKKVHECCGKSTAPVVFKLARRYMGSADVLDSRQVFPPQLSPEVAFPSNPHLEHHFRLGALSPSHQELMVAPSSPINCIEVSLCRCNSIRSPVKLSLILRTHRAFNPFLDIFPDIYQILESISVSSCSHENVLGTVWMRAPDPAAVERGATLFDFLQTTCGAV